MKYIVTFFWAFAIGQAVCYLGGALQGGVYDFQLSTIISLAMGLLTILISTFVRSKQETSKKTMH
ncbi:hypothetical protein NRIC_36440 [Enterococcus florum]|uniref:DUF2929 domain-containing protein n=1 Tax=Enterococcus florum TaxID=2480627 RepID=A0A4P5PT78_9ENTE|nr:YjzD family protein [Enterococcus florum]GCF95753.1 hypothetical protein NRIC_36440 [Enterococcus florum]